jgi:hypothetical protein
MRQPAVPTGLSGIWAGCQPSSQVARPVKGILSESTCGTQEKAPNRLAGLVNRLANNADVVAFKMGRRRRHHYLRDDALELKGRWDLRPAAQVFRLRPRSVLEAFAVKPS